MLESFANQNLFSIHFTVQLGPGNPGGNVKMLLALGKYLQYYFKNVCFRCFKKKKNQFFKISI